MSQQHYRPRASALLPLPTDPAGTFANPSFGQSDCASPSHCHHSPPCKTLQETPKAPSPDVPPEILQTIFRSLNIYDLLRCQRVSKIWRSHLPGNDPLLRRTLFTPSRTALQAHPEATPRLTFKVFVEIFVTQEDHKLPHLAYNINLNHRLKKTNMPAHVALHPIIKDFAHSMGLVNDEFYHPHDWPDVQRADIEPWLCFTTLADLQRKVRQRAYSDGNWKDQLMCVPAIEQVVIQLNWLKERGQGQDGKRSMRTRKMDKGVTVGEFVWAVREMLTRYAVEDVMRVAPSLEIMGCGKCGDGDESDLYWMPGEEEVSSDEGEDTESDEGEGDEENSEDVGNGQVDEGDEDEKMDEA